MKHKISEAVTHTTRGYNAKVNQSTAGHAEYYTGFKINADMGIL